MMDLLRPVLELTVVIPGVLLAYLPMKHRLRMHPGRLAAIMVSLLAILCIAGGSLCYYLETGTGWMLLLIVILSVFVYIRTLDVSRWKSVNVVLAVCAVFSCLNSIARSIDALIVETGGGIWFCLSAGLIYNLMCFVFVAAAWYPATHAVTELLDEEGIVQTWYSFWILPAVFIGLNLFMIPVNPGILYQGRIMQGYIVISFILLAVLCLFYAMFYLMARNLTRNDRLRQENLFLSMQQAQCNSLKAAIEETRQARHDMRHHFQVLSSLVTQREWSEVEKYLVQAQESIPATELILCHNPAVNAVACHYAALYKKNGLPCALEFDLPDKLPVAELDLCLVLSNLLENALEASLRTDQTKRRIKVTAHLHAGSLVLLTVENSFDGKVREKDGIFQSSKRRGNGTGIQSVRRIVEKSGGYCQFRHGDGIFTANVMLRGS